MCAVLDRRMLLEVVMVVEMVARGVREQRLEQPQGHTEQVGLS